MPCPGHSRFPYSLSPADRTCDDCCGTGWVDLSQSGRCPCETCNAQGVVCDDDLWLKSGLGDEPSPSELDEQRELASSQVEAA